MFRHLAPVTTPLAPATLLRGLRSPSATVERFEKSLYEYLGVPACFLAASGRTALYLLLKSLLADPAYQGRRRVILPAYTCPSLAKVVLDLGLESWLVDIAPTTFAYALPELAAQLNEQTLAVLLVHPFGIPQALAPVQQLTAQVGAVLIEDAAQSLGAMVAGKPVGTMGDYGLFSLGPGKPLSTGGGGFVCAHDPVKINRLAETWRTLPKPAASASGLALARLAAFTLAFHPQGWWLATRAGAQRVGENEASWGYAVQRLTPAQATIGLAQLSHLADYNRERRAKAERLIAQLQALANVQIPVSDAGDDATPIYLRLPVLLASETLREKLFAQLHAAGIGAGRMYARTMAEFFPKAKRGAYPGAEQIARQLLTLPTHHYVTEQDVARMGRIFREHSE